MTIPKEVSRSPPHRQPPRDSKILGSWSAMMRWAVADVDLRLLILHQPWIKLLLRAEIPNNNHPGMVYETWLKNGINYQPQLGTVAGFQPSTVWTNQLLSSKNHCECVFLRNQKKVAKCWKRILKLLTPLDWSRVPFGLGDKSWRTSWMRMFFLKSPFGLEVDHISKSLCHKRLTHLVFGQDVFIEIASSWIP